MNGALTYYVLMSNPEISNIWPSCSLLTFIDLGVKLKVLLKFKLNLMIIIRVDDENPWFSLVFNLVLMNFDSNFPGSNGLNLEIKVKMIQI